MHQFNFVSQRHPVLTGIATTTSIAICGDTASQFISQKYHHRPFRWDFGRTVKFGICGFFFAPQMVLWYRNLNRALPGKSAVNVVKRLCTDQLVFASYSCAFYLSSCCILDGGTMQETLNELHSKWFKTYRALNVYWILPQIVMFSVVPPHLHVLWVNVVSLGWTAFLSHQAHTDSGSESISPRTSPCHRVDGIEFERIPFENERVYNHFCL